MALACWWPPTAHFRIQDRPQLSTIALSCVEVLMEVQNATLVLLHPVGTYDSRNVQARREHDTLVVFQNRYAILQISNPSTAR